jgi:hypothetical protein
LDVARTDYIEKYQRGEETQEDYINLQLGRERIRHEKIERELKIAGRRKEVNGELTESLRGFNSPETMATLRGIAAGNAGRIVSTKPDAVEYLGGNDEVVELLSIEIEHWRPVCHRLFFEGGPNAAQTGADAKAVCSALRFGQGPWDTIQYDDQETAESIARKIRDAANGRLRVDMLPIGQPPTRSVVELWSTTLGESVHVEDNESLKSLEGIKIHRPFDAAAVAPTPAKGPQFEQEATFVNVYTALGTRVPLFSGYAVGNVVSYAGARFAVRKGPMRADEEKLVAGFRREDTGASSVAAVRSLVDGLNVAFKKAGDLLREKQNPRARLPFKLHPENMTREERKEREEAEQKVVSGVFARDQHLKGLLSSVRSVCGTFDLASFGLKLETRNGLQLVISDEKKLAAALKNGLPGFAGHESAAQVRKRLAGERSDADGSRGGLLTQLCESVSVCEAQVTDRHRSEDLRYIELQTRFNRAYENLLKKEQCLVEKYNKVNAKMREIESMLSLMMSVQMQSSGGSKW